MCAHAGTDASRHVVANRLHTLRRRVDIECHVQSGFQIGCNCLGIRIPAGFRHTLSNTLKDVGAGFCGI